jgi:hypothetical protein
MKQEFQAKGHPYVIAPNLVAGANIYAIEGDNLILSQPVNNVANPNNTYKFYDNPAKPGQGKIQAASQLVASIIGDVVSHFADIPGSTDWRGRPLSKSDDPKVNEVRDANRQHVTNTVIIPLLYGSPTTQTPPYATPPQPGNPKTIFAAQYDLDPLVWFVHEGKNWPATVNGKTTHRSIAAYAFSVDDGVGNITVNKSTAFEVAVGGYGGLTNTYVYRPKKP